MRQYLIACKRSTGEPLLWVNFERRLTGSTFATLRDAVEYMFELPEPHLDEPHWQFAVEALVKAARPASNRSELRAAEARLKMALMAEGVPGLRRG